MRYHYILPSEYGEHYGQLYICNHPIYDRCTLYLIGKKGLAVIQQKYDPITKHTWWQEIDSSFKDMLYLHPGFIGFFEEYAREPTDGLYPTVTLRQIMWHFKLKPLKREPWETVFDKKPL